MADTTEGATVSGSATGDPHLTDFNGVKFDHVGVDGKTYLFFETAGVTVTARVRAMPDGQQSIYDRVVVQVPNHRADVTLADVLLDGIEPTAEQAQQGGWVYTMGDSIGAWGYTVVEVPGGGTVCVHRNDGKGADLAGTNLEFVPHLQIFLTGPASWRSGTGVLPQGATTDTDSFAITAPASQAA